MREGFHKDGDAGGGANQRHVRGMEEEDCLRFFCCAQYEYRVILRALVIQYADASPYYEYVHVSTLVASDWWLHQDLSLVVHVRSCTIDS